MSFIHKTHLFISQLFLFRDDILKKKKRRFWRQTGFTLLSESQLIWKEEGEKKKKIFNLRRRQAMAWHLRI